MVDREPHSRVARLILEAVERLQLNLSGLRVLTEAATGPYAVTPVIAAVAGAEVIAFTKSTRYGTAAEVRHETMQLARELEVDSGIEITESLSDDQTLSADVVTNSGHLRPLNATFISRMKPGAVIPLMYEAWEFRPEDVDTEACRGRGVIVAGVNERHPDVGVFDYLGIAAVRGLTDCRIPVANCRVLVIAHNPFAPYIAGTLLACGAEVEVLTDPEFANGLTGVCSQWSGPREFDAVVVADPGPKPVIGRTGQAKYTVDELGTLGAVVQLYGDVDRSHLGNRAYCPTTEPARGHMGLNLSQLGPDPVVRLHAGGLKVGQLLASRERDAGLFKAYCQPIDDSVTRLFTQ